MPSRTLTPDLSLSPEPPGWAEPLGPWLVKVPDAAPPYDCETHGPACAATRAGTRAKVRAASAGRASAGRAGGKAAAARAARTAGTAGATGTGLAGTAGMVGAPGPAGAAEGAVAWHRQFAQVVVEILGGTRSARQVVPVTTDRARAQMGRLILRLASDERPRITRIVTSRPTATVVEMAVIVSFGPRSRALAMRFEHTAGRPATPGLPARPARWLCTELEAA
jgi:hypothetical protein